MVDLDYYTSVTRWGDFVLVRGIKDGGRKSFRDEYSPTLFVEEQGESAAPYTSLRGISLQSVPFSTMKEADNFVRQYQYVDYPIYGNRMYKYAWISDNFRSEIDFDFDALNVAILDIECECENGFPNVSVAEEKVNAITLKYLHGKTYLFGLDAEFEKGDLVDSDVTYISCIDEQALFREFLRVWRKNLPDILTGWNVEFFDVPYLVNRMNAIDNSKNRIDAKMLSPWKSVLPRDKTWNGKRVPTFGLVGIETLDYLALYKKFTYQNQESYKLDHIARVELDMQKLDYSEFDTIKAFYRNDYQKYMAYNVIDAEIIEELEKSKKLIELAVTMAYQAKVNFSDVFSPVKVWDMMIFNRLRNQKVVVDPKEEKEKSSKYAGAFVKSPEVGMHKWVVSFDLNSLYPSIIRQWNISPETILEGKTLKGSTDEFLAQSVDVKTPNVVAANGQMFDHDKKGLLPELVEELYEERVRVKQEMFEAKQELQKIKEKLSNG